MRRLLFAVVVVAMGISACASTRQRTAGQQRLQILAACIESACPQVLIDPAFENARERLAADIRERKVRWIAAGGHDGRVFDYGMLCLDPTCSGSVNLAIEFGVETVKSGSIGKDRHANLLDDDGLR